MQQTETYKLNLIETSDTFSPEALNENAQKIETALSDARAEAAAATAAGDAAVRADTAAWGAVLEQRIIALEGKHVVGGTYAGTGSPQTVQLGFTPQIVFMYSNNSKYDMIHQGSTSSHYRIVEGGFYIGSSFNSAGTTYMFIAIG